MATAKSLSRNTPTRLPKEAFIQKLRGHLYNNNNSRNIPYLRQQFAALLGNTSTSVKFICVVVLCLYCTYLFFTNSAIELLSITPSLLLPPQPWIWTLFTFCFLEIHFWEVGADIITVGLCGKLIEPLWGAIEMMTFFGIVNIGVAVLSTLFYLFLYTCTNNPDLLFKIHIHGLAGYIAGVSVAVKQIMPDFVLLKTPVGKITNRNIPLMVWVVSLILRLIGLLEGTHPTMFLSGLLVSWIYLRFYQRHNNGTRGDMADNFTFARYFKNLMRWRNSGTGIRFIPSKSFRKVMSGIRAGKMSSFFPNVLQPPIAVVSNTIHRFFVRIGICKKVVRRFDMSNAPPGLVINLPGIDPHDSERRRQIALKALSERLSKDHSKTWQQDKNKKHASAPHSVTVPMPETVTSKTTANANVSEVSVDIHSPPSSSNT